jgi:hypothetical protein
VGEDRAEDEVTSTVSTQSRKGAKKRFTEARLSVDVVGRVAANDARKRERKYKNHRNLVLVFRSCFLATRLRRDIDAQQSPWRYPQKRFFCGSLCFLGVFAPLCRDSKNWNIVVAFDETVSRR